jgi:hypothetical protein
MQLTVAGKMKTCPIDEADRDSNHHTPPAESAGKLHSYGAVAALILSRLGTNAAVMLWIFLDVPIFIAYVICSVGFACAVLTLIRRGSRENRGPWMSKAGLVICLFWIPIFVMAHWGAPQRIARIRRALCGAESDGRPGPELALPRYDPKLIIAHVPLDVRRNALYIELYDDRALAIPDFFRGKIVGASLNDGSYVRISERELKAALSSQEISVEEAQKEIGAIGPKQQQ